MPENALYRRRKPRNAMMRLGGRVPIGMNSLNVLNRLPERDGMVPTVTDDGRIVYVPGTRGKTPDEKAQDIYGLEPSVDRKNILPNPVVSGELSANPAEWTAPAWLYELAKASLLPGHVAKGGEWGEEDVSDLALTLMGGAGAAGATMMPGGSVAGMGAKVAAKSLPMDEASRMARGGGNAGGPNAPTLAWWEQPRERCSTAEGARVGLS